MDRESPELIEQQMEETRESLTEKVSMLEHQVVGTIESATAAVHSVRSAVHDTVERVTESFKESVESVSTGVMSAMDVRKHAQKNPWAMVSGAAVAGFITGLVVFRRPGPTPMPAFTPRPTAEYVPVPVARRPGWLEDLFEMAGREVKKLAEQAMTTAIASVRHNVEEGIPNLIGHAVPEIMRNSPADDTCPPTPAYRENGPANHTGLRSGV